MALEQWQHRVASVVARAEAIAANPSAPNASRELADAEAEWRDVAATGTFELDPDTAGRFGALVEAARCGIAAAERAEAERRAAAEHAAALQGGADVALRAPRAGRGRECPRGPRERHAPSGRACRSRLTMTADRQLHERFLEASRAAVERHANYQDRVADQRTARSAVDARPSGSPGEEQLLRGRRGLPSGTSGRPSQLRTDALDPVVAERFACRRRTRTAPRRRAARRGRTGAASAGPAHRTADRARQRTRRWPTT